MTQLPLLQFEEAYFERPWGGQKLREHYRKSMPGDRPIGEAWLVADHPAHESRVVGGPFAGNTLQDVLKRNPDALLGSVAKPTRFGRFPLLLKLLDSAQPLSVQVHPNDEAALALKEADGGKTEMWHVLQSDPGAELICGLDPAFDAADFIAAARDGSIENFLGRFSAPAGTSVFVESGTVHAIGPGFLIAEIQQNSDLTYRIYDWKRRDPHGKQRELHLEKARAVTAFGRAHAGPIPPGQVRDEGGNRELLCRCPYFAAERLSVQGATLQRSGGKSFHLLLAAEGSFTVLTDHGESQMAPGACVLVPGAQQEYQISGQGIVLDYYVPDREADGR